MKRTPLATATNLIAGIALATFAGFGLAACGSAHNDSGTSTPSVVPTGTPQAPNIFLPWTRSANQAATIAAAGLTVTPMEPTASRRFVHLDVFVNGKRIHVPGGLGINIGPKGTNPVQGDPGVSSLLTRDGSGVLHISQAAVADVTLGQLFREWYVPLSAQRAGVYGPVKVYVNGKLRAGDPNQLVLDGGDEIAVVIGNGSVKVPSSYKFPAGE